MPPIASWAPMSVRRRRLNAVIANTAKPTTRTPMITRATVMASSCPRRSPGATSPAAPTAAAGEPATGEAGAGGRGLAGLVRRDRRVHRVREGPDHLVDVVAGLATGVRRPEPDRHRRLDAHLGAVLRRPRVRDAEGDRPREVLRVELLAAGEVEPALARRRRHDPAEAADPGPQVAAGRCPGGRGARREQGQGPDRKSVV